MFKINSDPVDKYKPVILRDWSKGEITDADPEDLPMDALVLSKDARYSPGKLKTLKTESRTYFFGDGGESMGRMSYHQSLRNHAGSESVTNHYYTHLKDSPDNKLYRIEDGSAYMLKNFLEQFDCIYNAYSGMVDVGGTFNQEPLNIQYISRNRFDDDDTINAWNYSQINTVKPTVLNEGDWLDIENDLGETIDSVVTTFDLTYEILGIIAGDYIKIDSEIMGIVSVGFDSLTVSRGQLGTSGAGHTIGAHVYASPYAQYRLTSTTLSIEELTSSSGADGYSIGDVLTYGYSFIRDDNQESAIIQNPDYEATVFDSGGYPYLYDYKIMVHNLNLDKRITAIRIYHRKDAGNWYFNKEIDINMAVEGEFTDYEWMTSTYFRYIRVDHDYLSHSSTYTYSQKSGMSIDSESTDLMYKISTDYGNRRIVGDVKKNGKEYKARLYVSVAGAVNTFSDDNYLDILEDDETAFTALAVWNRILFVFKENQLFIIDIRPLQETSWRVIDKRNFGTFNQDSVAVGSSGVYFANETGIMKFDGQDFNNLTEGRIADRYDDRGFEPIMCYDVINEELICYFESTKFAVYDRYGRWNTESPKYSPGSNILVGVDNDIFFPYTSGTNFYMVKKNGDTTYRLMNITTPDIRFDTDGDKIIRKLRVRFENPESGTFFVQLSINHGAFATLVSSGGTARGADGDYILEWTGKKRFKSLALNLFAQSYINMTIKEVILWVAPRKGRRNA